MLCALRAQLKKNGTKKYLLDAADTIFSRNLGLFGKDDVGSQTHSNGVTED